MKKLLAATVSLIILAVIYSRIDLPELWGTFKTCRVELLIASLAMVIPTTFFTSLRLKIMAPKNVHMQLGQAVKLTLAASVMNMVLPSKMGDVAKAVFIKDKNESTTSIGLPLVIFEKSCDLLSLLAWCTLGLLMLPKDNWVFWPLTAGTISILLLGVLLIASKKFANFFFALAIRFAPAIIKKPFIKLQDAWDIMHAYFWEHRRRLYIVIATSLLIWFLHLLQIWMFIIAVNGSCPFVISMGLTALSILAGLIIPSFAGIGSRDGALLFFYSSYISLEQCAAVGILCTMRYIMPAIGGLPFFAKYLSALDNKNRK